MPAQAKVPACGRGGQILTTTDGGLKWAEVGTNVMPGLSAVRFLDEKTGVAVYFGEPNRRLSTPAPIGATTSA